MRDHLADLSEIANGVKEIPEEWISEDGVSMSAKFIKCASPSFRVRCRFPTKWSSLLRRLSKKRIRRFWILTNSNKA